MRISALIVKSSDTYFRNFVAILGPHYVHLRIREHEGYGMGTTFQVQNESVRDIFLRKILEITDNYSKI